MVVVVVVVYQVRNELNIGWLLFIPSIPNDFQINHYHKPTVVLSLICSRPQGEIYLVKYSQNNFQNVGKWGLNEFIPSALGALHSKKALRVYFCQS